jgi:hypothetical protein
MLRESSLFDFDVALVGLAWEELSDADDDEDDAGLVWGDGAFRTGADFGVRAEDDDEDEEIDESSVSDAELPIRVLLDAPVPYGEDLKSSSVMESSSVELRPLARETSRLKPKVNSASANVIRPPPFRSPNGADRSASKQRTVCLETNPMVVMC